MIKRLLSAMVFLALIGTSGANAQTRAMQRAQTPVKSLLQIDKNKRMKSTLIKAKVAKKVNKAIELEEGQMWFGYTNDNDLMSLGSRDNSDNHLAIYIPYDKIAAPGATIDGISFLFQSKKAKNMKVWVSTTLPEVGHYADGADLEIKDVDVMSLSNTEYNDVLFSQSYVIPEGGVYIGLSYDMEGIPQAPSDEGVSDEDYTDWYYDVYMPWYMDNLEDCDPFFVSGSMVDVPGTFLWASNYLDDLYRGYADEDPEYLDYLGWFDYSIYGDAVALKALVGGNKFMNNAAEAENFGEKYSLLNENVVFPVTITNRGKQGISSFNYKVYENNQVVGTGEVELEEPISELLRTNVIDVTVPGFATTGAHKLQLEVDKVNGQPNEVSKKAEGAVFTIANSAVNKPVIEEFTGTACGWCPRGMMAMERLAADFGQDIVQIAIHTYTTSDPMYIASYTPLTSLINGYPSALINRTALVDPYYGHDADYGQPYDVKYDIEDAMNNVAAAGISAKAEWADEAQTKIKVTTETTFQYDESEPSLAIAYVVCADGLEGPGSKWGQANYYSGNEDYADGDSYLLELVEQDDYIYPQFNHVAIAAYGIEYGVEGSLSGQVKAGEPISTTYEIDLAGNKLVQDKDLLSVATLLINKTTGAIVNGDKAYLNAEASVTTVNASDGSEAKDIYTASGVKVAKLQKGINIVRLANGTTKKVVVK